MKKLFLTAILSGSVLRLAAAPVVIDDFEKGKPDGWTVYKDAKSPAAQLAVTDDAISGDGALKVMLGGCTRYQGIQFFKVPVMPEKAVAVSFLVKPVSGPPTTALALSERKERYGRDLATAVANLKISGDDWQKITVPLASMKYGSGPERGKAFPFKPGAVYSLRFYGAVSERPSVFLLDDIVWETE